MDNGIPIESWFDDDADEELLKLLPFLESLNAHDDLRVPLRDQFQLRRVVESAGQQGGATPKAVGR